MSSSVVTGEHEPAARDGRAGGQPGCVARTGVTFEVGAEVTGARVRVEVQLPDRRVQVMFGSHYRGFLMLWMSDPDEIAELASTLTRAGVELSDALASGRCPS